MRAVVLEEAEGVGRHLRCLRHALLSGVGVNLLGQRGQWRWGVEQSAPVRLGGGIVVAEGRAVGNGAGPGGAGSSLALGVGSRLVSGGPSSAVL